MGRLSRSPEHCTDACDQLLNAKGLGDIVVGAQLQADDFIAFFQFGC